MASIPSGHPYVRHALERVNLLPDPAPPGATDGRWWPPVMCDAAWVAANRHRFDVMHVHFGTESFPSAHLRSLVLALRAHGKPLVYTVHDLENPQLTDQTRHREHLDILVPAADAVVTLTAGAAAEIERRWGRTAEVVPHPHVLDPRAHAPIGHRSQPYVLGMHLRDLRPGIDAAGATAALLEVVDRLDAPAIARVHLNNRVRDDKAAETVTALVSAHPAAELRRSERLDDNALAASIADLDVAVLPYRSGTHSGWAELCWDLGVPVAAPRIGFLGEQHPEDFAALDAGAVRRLLTAAPRPGTAARAARIAERRRIRARTAATISAAHLALYERLLAPAELVA